MNKFKFFFIFILFLSINVVASYQARVAASTLNIRESRTVNSKVVGKLQKDDVVQVDTCYSGFCKIKFGSILGYASETYLNQTANLTDSAQNLRQTSNQSLSKKELSSDGWGYLVLFIMIALGVTEFGFRKNVGCVAAVGSVFIIGFLYLLLEIFHASTVCEAFFIASAIFLIFWRNKKFSPTHSKQCETYDSREQKSASQEMIVSRKKIRSPQKTVSPSKGVSIDSCADAIINFVEALGLGAGDNAKSGRKEIIYCRWSSSEYGQYFYDTFSRNTSSRDVEKILERKYGKGRLCNSVRAKVPPGWYELENDKEIMYCQWYSSEYGQYFYGTFSRNTSGREVEKVLERKYGKGRLSNSARTKIPPSWFELDDEKEVFYCQWYSSEYGQRFYEAFPRNVSSREAEKVLEREYGKGRFGNSTRAKTPPGWYEL